MVEMVAPLSNEEIQAAPPETAKPGKQPICPVPDDAPPMQFRHPKHGKPSNSWAYQDARGRLVGYVCRFDFCDAAGTPGKDILPVIYCELDDGRQAWRAAGIPSPRPLYRLPDILAKPDAPVLVVEGEKACDAAVALFPVAVATTPAHGAKSPKKSDWSVLQGRRVAVWPDNDDAGLGD